MSTHKQEKKKWQDVTETFTEKQRHYNGKYLEICEICNKLEVSLFSAPDDDYEIYVSFGAMYGIVYATKERADFLYEEIKDVIMREYETNGEPDLKSNSDFITEFDNKYHICLPNDLFFNLDLGF